MKLRDLEIGQEFVLNGQIFKRIEAEGFYPEGPATAESVVLHSRSRPAEKFSFDLDREVTPLALRHIETVQ